MAGCYHCGISLAKGQGVRKNVRTGTSVAGLFSSPPSLFLVVFAILAGIKVPPTRSYFGLRSLCPVCAQRLDDQRASRRKIFLSIVGLLLIVGVAAALSAKH
jgi:hypothetical protein